ncbi:MAG: hypothetical protein M3Q56_02305 [Bacteroidota bacterium]|nr:hypothetical protein [Bacteroidota bacterium]
MEYIKIGHGGGFVGKEDNFTLYLDGIIESEGVSFRKLSKNDVAQLKENYSKLGIKSIEKTNPGNLYKFLEFNFDNKVHRIVWNGVEQEEDKNLNLYYTYFNHLIQKAKK